MRHHVRKAIFPVAGLGTRFLPATKSSPKEMLPLIDKPLVQYVVEEAVASGIEQIIFVTGRTKRSIEDHFDSSPELELHLEEKGKGETLQEVREIADLVEIFYVRQKKALGLGHAILCARDFIGNEPFAVLLGDDIIDGESPCLSQLLDLHTQTGASVLALEEVPHDQISSYGCVEVKNGSMPLQVTDMIEKPSPDEAPSDLAIIGRYVLTPTIFPILEALPPGRGGEIQLTDALRVLKEREPIYGCCFTGTRHDCGDKLGFLKATIDLAMKREEFRPALTTYLSALLANYRSDKSL